MFGLKVAWHSRRTAALEKCGLTDPEERARKGWLQLASRADPSPGPGIRSAPGGGPAALGFHRVLWICIGRKRTSQTLKIRKMPEGGVVFGVACNCSVINAKSLEAPKFITFKDVE